MKNIFNFEHQSIDALRELQAIYHDSVTKSFEGVHYSSFNSDSDNMHAMFAEEAAPQATPVEQQPEAVAQAQVTRPVLSIVNEVQTDTPLTVQQMDDQRVAEARAQVQAARAPDANAQTFPDTQMHYNEAA